MPSFKNFLSSSLSFEHLEKIKNVMSFIELLSDISTSSMHLHLLLLPIKALESSRYKTLKLNV